MRRTGIQRALWLALTALLILSGAVMPFATVWLQDTYAGERAERRPFEAVRLSLRQIGQANILCARTRPKFVGGVRAHYNEELL